MASIRRSFTIFSTATKSLTSRDKNGPLSKSSLSGRVLCPAAITFSDPYLFRKAGISSEPIWPVAPVTNIRFIIYPLSLFIQSVITSHTCVVPRLVVAAYAKNTPHSSPSSRLGLLCSDALYEALFMSLCLTLQSASALFQTNPRLSRNQPTVILAPQGLCLWRQCTWMLTCLQGAVVRLICRRQYRVSAKQPSQSGLPGQSAASILHPQQRLMRLQHRPVSLQALPAS